MSLDLIWGLGFNLLRNVSAALVTSGSRPSDNGTKRTRLSYAGK